jgi:hypothetical protein
MDGSIELHATNPAATGLHRRVDTTPATQRATLHPSCGTPLAPATGCTHRAHVPSGSAAPTSCASLRCPRHPPMSRITPGLPSQSSMDAPPPHGPDSLQRSTAPTPRSTESSAISSRSAVPRRGLYSLRCTEIHPSFRADFAHWSLVAEVCSRQALPGSRHRGVLHAALWASC